MEEGGQLEPQISRKAHELKAPSTSDRDAKVAITTGGLVESQFKTKLESNDQT